MNRRSILSRIGKELGLATLLSSTRDVHFLMVTRFLRMFAYGSSTLILAMFFETLGHSDTKIGLFMSLTLVGDVLISLALTFVADRFGRRNILILGSLLMTFSGVIFATISNYWILLLAAVVGVISPSGNEIGPFRAVEESTLAQLSDAATRSDIFAWYIVIGTLGSAGGSLSCGWFTQSLLDAGWSQVAAYESVFWIYAVIGFVKAIVGLFLSRRCEVQPVLKTTPPSRGQERDQSEEHEPFLDDEESSRQDAPVRPQPPPPPKEKSFFAQISPNSRIILLKVSALMFVDSLASGMVPYSLIAFFMERKFSMPESSLGSIISAAQFVSSIGNIFASSVAKRIGLVRAMVFTHLPSSILLALIPLPSSLMITTIILVLRASLASMDQAPRSAFISAIVLPEERTATMGIVNTVKTMAQSSGPLITGTLAGGGRFWLAFIAAGALKASYDLGMLKMFVNLNLEGDKGSKSAKRDPPAAQQDYEEFALEGSDDGTETELDDFQRKKSGDSSTDE